MGNYRLGMEYNEGFGTYLAHHGIKGQKWGVRRFQNPDGSLTEEGKLRYSNYGLFQNRFEEMRQSFAKSAKSTNGHGYTAHVDDSIIDRYYKNMANAINSSGATEAYTRYRLLERELNRTSPINVNKRAKIKREIEQRMKETQDKVNKSLIMTVNMLYDDVDFSKLSDHERQDAETYIYGMLSQYGAQASKTLNVSVTEALRYANNT